MNREQAKEHLAVITAFANGEVIEHQQVDGSWDPVKYLYPGGEAKRYRVAPPPPRVFYIATCVKDTGPYFTGETKTVTEEVYNAYKNGGNSYWKYTKTVEVR